MLNMNIVKIDGKIYDVLVTELSENFNILYSENTGRTMSVGARMSLDPLGTFYGHKVTFNRKQGYEKEFDELYSHIRAPRIDGLNIEIVHNQDTIKYDAYISSGERKLKRVDIKTGKVYWDSLSVNIVPMEAQVTL